MRTLEEKTGSGYRGVGSRGIGGDFGQRGVCMFKRGAWHRALRQGPRTVNPDGNRRNERHLFQGVVTEGA